MTATEQLIEMATKSLPNAQTPNLMSAAKVCLMQAEKMFKAGHTYNAANQATASISYSAGSRSDVAKKAYALFSTVRS